MFPDSNDSDCIPKNQALSKIIYGEPASKARPVFIYALKDPRDGNVRYVGRSFAPEKRYKAHLREGGDTHKARWIKQLMDLKSQPELEILECVAASDWSEAERRWMAKYDNLTNSCSGGYGLLNPTAETRLKMRARKFGKTLTKEHCAKVSAALKGKKKPPRTKEHIAKISKSRETVAITPEWKANLSKANMLRKPASKAGYKGVYYDSSRGKYQAGIRVGKKVIHLGRFTSAEDAANAYNQAATKHGWPPEGLNVI